MAWEFLGSLGSAVGGYLANRTQEQAAGRAAGLQQNAISNQLNSLNSSFNSGLGAQQNQFNSNLGLQQGFLNDALGRAQGMGDQQLSQLQGLFSPYTQAGSNALGGINQYGQGGLQAFQQQQALSGGLGAAAQQQAIGGLESSPIFQALARQGEDAILQNASATGGLRGGNVQGALAQFRPGLLNQFAQQQFGNLGSLSALGASNLGLLGQLGGQAASNQAQGGQNVLGSQLSLLGQLYGNAAGNVGTASNQFMNNLGQLYGDYGANTANLLGQQGSVGAQGALSQGYFRGRGQSTLGSLGGLSAQQSAEQYFKR